MAVPSSTAFGSNMVLPVHRWFRYSAGFSAGWAEQVIRESGARRVLDPFAGSGTTVLAAESAGAEGIGVDAHPFVTRVARAKLRWRADPGSLVARAEAVVALASASGEVPVAASPLLHRCFDPGSLLALTRLRDAVAALRAGDDQDELLWLALVSILRTCSPVGTAQWQYVLPNRSKARVEEPVAAFLQRVALFADDMRERATAVAAPGGVVVDDDARTLAPVPDGWADLVLTSPPYANNYDYADAARLEMSFLGEVSGWGDLTPLRDRLMKSCSHQMGGWDPTGALSSPLLEPIAAELGTVYEELGAVRKEKAGCKAYHLMVVGYFHDSAQVLRALRHVCATGGRVCVVVGDSAPYGVHVPVEEWLGRLAVAAGFRSWTFDVARTRNHRWRNRKHRVPLKEGRLWLEG